MINIIVSAFKISTDKNLKKSQPFSMQKILHVVIFSIISTKLFLPAEVSAQATKTEQAHAISTKVEGTSQQVEVKAKSEVEAARTDAASKSIISNTELLKFGDSNILDALKRTPGIVVVQDQLQLLGMSAAYTQILIDGEPLRGIAIADLPMNIIDRVEIHRAGSAQFSSQAMAGTINIILKRVPSTTQKQIKISVSNSYKTIGNIEWLNSDKRDNFSYSLSLSGGELESPLAPAQKLTESISPEHDTVQKYTQDKTRNVNVRNIRLNPRIQYKTEAGVNWTSTSSFSANKSSVLEDSTYHFLIGSHLPVSRTFRDFNSNTAAGSSNLRATFDLKNHIKVDINGGINARDWIRKWVDCAFNNNTSPDFQFNVYARLKTVGLENSGKITAPSSADHDITGGWSISNLKSHNKRLETLHRDTSAIASYDDQRANTTIDKWAVFVQDEWKFRKNSSAYLGLRWESVRIQSNGTTQEELRHHSNVLSPVVQTVWQLDSDNINRLRFGVSRTYKAPTDFQLIAPTWKTINNTIQNPSSRGNPNLRPELAWSLDGAYEHNGKDSWNYNIRVKLRSIEDLHQGNVVKIDNDWWFSYINAGHAISKSLEFDTQFPLKRFLNNGPNINFNFDMSKNWSKVSYLQSPYNLLTPITSNAKLGIDFHSKSYPLNLGINIRQTHSEWQQVSTTTREYTATPTVIDLYALWKINKQSQLRFAIDNLLKHRVPNQIEQNFEETRLITSFLTPVMRRVALNFEHKF